MSIHRAMTVGPISGLCQVIIKNTNASKESVSSATINRSQSLLTNNRTPILAPPRADRIRLEALLADVWTRDMLPYPGMTGRARSEHLVRTSATSMMRKLSVASITSNFAKRSGSMASLYNPTEDDIVNENEIPTTYSPVRVDQRSSDANVLSETDDVAKSQLSVILDEKETAVKDSCESIPGLQIGANGSPASTLNRLATLKNKKSRGNEGQRVVTPPLRTSSANSLSQTRTITPPVVTDSAIEEKENIYLGKTISMVPEPERSEKKIRGFGKSGRIAVPGGFRSFFR